MTVLKSPFLITITGPSGTGKDSVIQGLVNQFPEYRRNPSCTTRPSRPGEEEGVDYFFITPERFEELWAAGDLVERSAHYNNHYGVRLKVVTDLLEGGFYPLKDMTFSGVQACSDALPGQVFKIALLPPSRERLFARLTKRDPNLSEEGKARFKQIAEDLDFIHDPAYVFTNPDMKGSKLTDYDAVFVNEDLEVTVYSVARRIQEEREKRGG